VPNPHRAPDRLRNPTLAQNGFLTDDYESLGIGAHATPRKKWMIWRSATFALTQTPDPATLHLVVSLPGYARLGVIGQC
jgi:hypothetical protein